MAIYATSVELVDPATGQVCPVSSTTGLTVTLAANPGAVEAGGVLDRSDQWLRLLAVVAQQALMTTQAQGANGFVPLETPSFLIG